VKREDPPNENKKEKSKPYREAGLFSRGKDVERKASKSIPVDKNSMEAKPDKKETKIVWYGVKQDPNRKVTRFSDCPSADLALPSAPAPGEQVEHASLLHPVT